MLSYHPKLWKHTITFRSSLSFVMVRLSKNSNKSSLQPALPSSPQGQKIPRTLYGKHCRWNGSAFQKYTKPETNYQGHVCSMVLSTWGNKPFFSLVRTKAEGKAKRGNSKKQRESLKTRLPEVRNKTLTHIYLVSPFLIETVKVLLDKHAVIPTEVMKAHYYFSLISVICDGQTV